MNAVIEIDQNLQQSHHAMGHANHAVAVVWLFVFLLGGLLIETSSWVAAAAQTALRRTAGGRSFAAYKLAAVAFMLTLMAIS